MSDILEDPNDDTKGFFDPNTNENLTYLQLMNRCVEDPETKLLLLYIEEVCSAIKFLNNAMNNLFLFNRSKIRQKSTLVLMK